jgi:hypothetical protein
MKSNQRRIDEVKQIIEGQGGDRMLWIFALIMVGAAILISFYPFAPAP